MAVNNAIVQILWTCYFLERQGFAVKNNIVYQDNMSTMLMAKNGKLSSGKRTRHMDIRLFFVTDHVRSGEIQILHEPMEEICGDFYTKLLQGVAFKKFRNLILIVTD